MEISSWSESFERYDSLVERANLITNAVYPALLSKIVTSGPVLDFGGGTGRLGSLLPEDVEVTLYDPNVHAIERARSIGRCNLANRRCVSHERDLPTQYYVNAALLFVLMSVPTAALERSTMTSVRDRLKLGASVQVVITDPRNRAAPFSCFETDFSRGRALKHAKVDDLFTVYLLDRRSGEELAIPNYHRPLESTITSMNLSGLAVASIERLPDYNPSGWANRSVNPYLMINAIAV